MTARNGFFGVKNLHIATIKDDDTYNTPVHIPGVVEISLEPAISSGQSYADNEVWVDVTKDNGGTGSIIIYDAETDETTRALIATLLGDYIDAKKRMVDSADGEGVPFALMCEQEGKVSGKRVCKYRCTLSKPSLSAHTTEDTPAPSQSTYNLKYRPIALTDGSRVSGYTDYPGTTTYDDFFKAVDVTNTVKPETTSGDVQ